jgi:hypothetical protein
VAGNRFKDLQLAQRGVLHPLFRAIYKRSSMNIIKNFKPC